MVVVLVVTRDDLTRPGWAVVMAVGTLLVTLSLGACSRWAPHLLRNRVVVAFEVLVGAALLAADGWVYGGAHSQSLGSAWPLAGALTAGVVAGPVAGAAAGVVLGLGRAWGTVLDDLPSPGTLSLLSTGVLFALAGGAAGVVMGRLRRAEREIAATRAREEVARTLHDGVLQTLAVVQRRSSDPELADLARTQERELREFLFGVDRPPGDLVAELRREGHSAERRLDLAVTVTAVDDPEPLPAEVVSALVGAVREALTNAAKHGGAAKAVVFVDPDDPRDGGDGLFLSVYDDGCGFDPTAAAEGVGLARSIRGRIAEVGGRVEIASSPGHGTEVRIHLDDR
jgi:signal transduction histidine kinase